MFKREMPNSLFSSKRIPNLVYDFFSIPIKMVSSRNCPILEAKRARQEAQEAAIVAQQAAQVVQQTVYDNDYSPCHPRPKCKPRCPVCPPQKRCPVCPPQKRCPVCPPPPKCPVCPEKICPLCPPEKICPGCEACPPCPECAQCPVCPPEKICPECASCPVCPPEKICPICAPEKVCPSCPPPLTPCELGKLAMQAQKKASQQSPESKTESFCTFPQQDDYYQSPCDSELTCPIAPPSKPLSYCRPAPFSGSGGRKYFYISEAYGTPIETPQEMPMFAE